MKTALLAAALVGITVPAAVADPPGPKAPQAEQGGATRDDQRLVPADAPGFKRITRPVIWEMMFADGITAKEYAAQLDAFEIELAAADNKGQVQYATRLSSPKPERHSGKLIDDTRVMIEWKNGDLVAFDRKFLTKAGIAAGNKRILHFYPPAAERQLYELERAYAGADAPDVVRTRFGIRESETDKTSPPSYEFYVVEQELKEKATPGSSASARSQKEK